ncbi:guanine nucleotide-binding protein G(i) subunit alpha-3-like [Discoglossus pictus]
MSCIQNLMYTKAAARSKMIDEALLQEKTKLCEAMKVLMLGPRECGKSTIMKQMKIIHGGGYSEEERRQYRAAIYRDIIQSINEIISDMERLGIHFGDMARAEDARQLLVSSAEGGVMSQELAGIIQRLWEDVGVQDCITYTRFSRHSHTALYYLNNLDWIFQANYIPTQQDVLLARVKTSGIEEEIYTYSDSNIRVMKVPGQTFISEKWMHYFEGVDAIVFLVALSDYDKGTTWMCENLELFDKICGCHWFRHIPIIIFFNKKDLFEEKISRVPLATFFPKHSGSNTFEEASGYIIQQFLDQSWEKYEKIIHFLITCATDTEYTKLVLCAMIDVMRFSKPTMFQSHFLHK